MLYISRRVFHANELCYVVVDTDDGVETVVNVDRLEYATRCGLIINGIPVKWETGDDITPYQYSGFIKPIQVKMRTLRKVSVTLCGSSITDISWLYSVDPIRVRLSDFGDSCTDFVIYGSVIPKNPVTLVLDDKLKSITSRSFRIDTGTSINDTIIHAISHNGGWKRIGVRFDVSELTKEELVDTFYEQLFWYNKALEVVTDSEERKLAMRRKYVGL